MRVRALVVLFALLLAAAPALAEGAPKVGSQAPGFKLPGTDGKTHALADFKGKSWVVLYWYPKAFTPGCTIECQQVRDTWSKLKDLQVQVFGASVDNPEANSRFAKEYELPFPLLSDPGRKVAQAYGVVTGEGGMARRWTFFIDPQGVIRAVDTDVNPMTSGQDILKVLKDLGVPKK